jgi:hypothetical protein
LATQQYSIKLIYLPDFDHPMLISQKVYPFTISDFKPSLQNGWMITGLDSSSDTTGSATISSLASLLGAVKGGGSSATGTSSSKSKSESNSAFDEFLKQDNIAPQNTPDFPVLPPGLYSLSYKDGTGASTQTATPFSGRLFLSGWSEKPGRLQKRFRLREAKVV